MTAPRAAMILPPREGFAPGATGAIGLLLSRLGRGGGQTVLGMLPGGFPGVDYVQAPPALWPAKLSQRYAMGLLRALRRLRPDIVEVHNRPDIALYLQAKLPGTPVCLILHNDPRGMRTATGLHRLAGVAAVSAWLAGRLDVPCAVLPNSLDLTAIPPSLPERDKLILFAGRVVADKGADGFVAACALALPRLPGWRAEMIGADRFGPDSPSTPFLTALTPKSQAAGIRMHGYRPHADVLAAMAAAAIVAVPSRWPEPFGLTALEAMAAGAALLVAPRGGLPEVAGDVGIPIDPDDPQGFAEAIVALANDAPRRATIAAAGRARAAQFGLPQATAALAEWRRDVLQAWPRRPGHPI